MKTANLKPSALRSSIKLQGSGADVGWALEHPLPVVLPLRVQLQSSSGLCWESVFSAATQNDASGVKAVQR